MAAKLLICTILISIFFINQVTAYYCDSDKCSVEEYCCGTNICCTSYAVWQMWYIWCGLVLFVLLLSSCAGFCIYRYYDTAAAIILHGGGGVSSTGGGAYTRLEEAKGNNTLYTAVPTKYMNVQEKYLPMEPPSYTQSYTPPVYPAGIPKDPNYKR